MVKQDVLGGKILHCQKRESVRKKRKPGIMVVDRKANVRASTKGTGPKAIKEGIRFGATSSRSTIFWRKEKGGEGEFAN